MNISELKIEPDFKNLLPPLDAETYTDLERDIISNGLINPIVIWNGYIADGHNRYEICKSHRIENVQVRELDKESKSDVMQWIVTNQFAKRNLTKSEKVILLAKVEEQIAKEAKERQGTRTDLNITSNLTEGSKSGNHYSETAEVMAKKLGVSKNTYKNMKAVVEKGTPKQIARMDEGGQGNSASAIAREIEYGVRDGERKCNHCGRILPLSMFNSKKNIFACDDCESERKKEQKIATQVMPDALNPDKVAEVPDDRIVERFRNILFDSLANFRMDLKYETRMSTEIREELIKIIDEFEKEITNLKGELKHETEGKGI